MMRPISFSGSGTCASASGGRRPFPRSRTSPSATCFWTRWTSTNPQTGRKPGRYRWPTSACAPTGTRPKSCCPVPPPPWKAKSGWPICGRRPGLNTPCAARTAASTTSCASATPPGKAASSGRRGWRRRPFSAARPPGMSARAGASGTTSNGTVPCSADAGRKRKAGWTWRHGLPGIAHVPSPSASRRWCRRSSAFRRLPPASSRRRKT